MKLATHLVCICLAFSPCLMVQIEAVEVEVYRAAVARALPHLEAGARGSAKERVCFTCHNQALPVFALVEAKKHGFEIDDSLLAQQVEHTYQHLYRGLDSYRQAKGQGGGVLTAGYAMWTLEEGGRQRDDVTQAVNHYLLETQRELTHWRRLGTRPPTFGSDYTATYVALRALQFYATNQQAESFASRRTGIAKWLADAIPSETEDLVFRLSSMEYVDVSDDVVSHAATDLLAKQRPDGGWGQKDDMASDAYATSTAIAALIRYGQTSPQNANIQKGLEFLLKHQLEDGTWHVTTRAKPIQEYFESGFPHGKDQFISISATAWATLALLYAMPDAEQTKSTIGRAQIATAPAQLVSSAPASGSPASNPELFDVVLTGGRIVDGTGAPWYIADVGIRSGKIAKIGRIERNSSNNYLDVSGMIVSPGFIDMMGQSASPMVDDPKAAINLLTQGITTINAGEGGSAAPLSQLEGKQQGYTTMAEYFALLNMRGMPVNVAQTVGHTQVRRLVIGEVDRRPTAEELSRMQDLVREAMQAGAIGVSTALIYPPAVFATTEEIAALARVAGEYGGRYYTHMRNEGDQLLEAIDEALDIGRQGKTPVHIFHLKTAGQQNWGKMQLAIAKIKAARAAGEQVTADIYPYVNNGLEISALIHPRHFGQGRDQLRRRLDDPTLRAEIRREMETTGGWENWFRHVNFDWQRIIIGQTNELRYRDTVGQSVAAIATANREDPWDTFFNLVKSGSFALPQSMTDANKILAMQQEFVSFCTDVGPAGGARYASHPRAFGSFPRLFARYVRDLGAISLERAVAQASAVAANDILAFDRGRISVGLAADLVVFDYQNLVDKATFTDPTALSTGVKHVLVNGELVLHNGEFTGKRPGRVLRGPGYQIEKAPAALRTGTAPKQLQAFDHLMQRFIEQHHVPGAALAITKGGKLVYSRGFGYADIAAKEQVQPTSLFRIASVSKPITAVAILQLIEAGQLKLDDPVFSILDFEAEIKAAGSAFDKRLRNVTIRHLLEHRGGWDRDLSFDAMFQSVRFAQQLNVPPPAGQREIIIAMLRVPLDFEPGERYAYSNFGYSLLGRVIEKLSGQTYATYVQQRVLAPAGISAMRIGATRLDGRQPGEVRYYAPGNGSSVFHADLGEDVSHCYGAWHLEAMDSHGGWIASAEELAKFAIALDDPTKSPLLSAASIAQMYQRPKGSAGYHDDGSPKKSFYSLGWSNLELNDGRINHWHTGSLPGTATLLLRRHDGCNLIALMNSRVSPEVEHLGRTIESELNKLADSITEWP